ncbi:MAG: formate dehydrogenase accessory sulfurtransferase FdhD [Chloroflexota bacterium]|nr:formate dehydrogenase accessory sulfurtransferase FdhD [Chloroflexota bacterium]
MGEVDFARPWRVLSFSQHEGEEKEIEIVREEALSIYINGRKVALLMRMPGKERELAAGFCVSEGLIKNFSDVLTIQHCEQKSVVAETESQSGQESAIPCNRVQVLVRPGALGGEGHLEVVRLIRAGGGAMDADRNELPLSMVSEGPRIDYRILFDLSRDMRAGQCAHKRVGGVHAAALYDVEGQRVVLCEDVGRHNAVDKAIGHCLLHDLPLLDKVLLCSGRLSYEMVTKAIRMGIPALASMSSPTTLAVEIADQFNLTLVGYLGGRHMTVYTHPERLYAIPQ